MYKRGISGKAVLFFFVLISLSLAIYFTFFFSYKCEDISCFRAHQEKCSRTEFINDLSDTTWNYKIHGKEGGSCEIEVEILQIKEGTNDKVRLEGQSMKCYLPLTEISSPESDLQRCHGLLKEELQEIMIKNAHKYIVDNIGDISEELNKAV